MGFPEAEARLFKNVYICMKCGARNRNRDKCRRCGSRRLRKKKMGQA